MKKALLSTLVTIAGIAVMSAQAQTEKDTVKKSTIIKTDTVKTRSKPKTTGGVYSTENVFALGTFERPQTDTSKTKAIKADTIKTQTRPNTTGSLNTAGTTIGALNGLASPETDTVKAKTKRITAMQTDAEPNATGTIHVEETNAYVALLLSQIEERIMNKK